jgi:hypothetical protein
MLKKAKLKSKIVNTKFKKFVLGHSHKIVANGGLTLVYYSVTVIDGAGFGQPGTTIQAAFGKMDLNRWCFMTQKLCSINLFSLV